MLGLTRIAQPAALISLTFCVSSAGWSHISKPLFSKTVFSKSSHLLCRFSLPLAVAPLCGEKSLGSVSCPEAA